MGKRLPQVPDEAVTQYLGGKGGSMVDRTRGALPAPVSLVQSLLDEDEIAVFSPSDLARPESRWIVKVSLSGILKRQGGLLGVYR